MGAEALLPPVLRGFLRSRRRSIILVHAALTHWKPPENWSDSCQSKQDDSLFFGNRRNIINFHWSLKQRSASIPTNLYGGSCNIFSQQKRFHWSSMKPILPTMRYYHMGKTCILGSFGWYFSRLNLRHHEQSLALCTHINHDEMFLFRPAIGRHLASWSTVPLANL